MKYRIEISEKNGSIYGKAILNNDFFLFNIREGESLSLFVYSKEEYTGTFIKTDQKSVTEIINWFINYFYDFFKLSKSDT